MTFKQATSLFFLLTLLAACAAGCESKTSETAISDAIAKDDPALAWFLAQRSGPHCRERYEVLATAMRTGTPKQVLSAISVLCSLPDRGQATIMIKACAARTDIDGKANALDGIAAMEDPAAMPFLLNLLATERGPVASATRDAIYQIKRSPDRCGLSRPHTINQIEHTDQEGIPHPNETQPRPGIPPITHLPEFTKWWEENRTSAMEQRSEFAHVYLWDINGDAIK